jgi:inner membrane transporter RhtA
MVLGAIVSVQLGSAIAVSLFDELSPAGVALLRLAVAAVVMGVWVAATRGTRGFALTGPIVLLGVDFALMNLALYEAADRIPLGPAVALEFLGPLGLALALSRRPADVLVALIALAGVLVLRPVGGSLDPLGAGLAVVSGGLWAGYILLIRRVSDRTSGVAALAPAFMVGAVLMAPIAMFQGLDGVGGAHVLSAGVVVAVLSSVVPYGLELAAIRHLPSRVFGVLMSIEPAFAALAGFAILGQRLGVTQVIGIALVVAACAAATAAYEPPGPSQETHSSPP